MITTLWLYYTYMFLELSNHYSGLPGSSEFPASATTHTRDEHLWRKLYKNIWLYVYIFIKEISVSKKRHIEIIVYLYYINLYL